MKSKLTYLICVISSFLIFAQTPETAGNTPGENTEVNISSEESATEKVRSLSNKIQRKKKKLEGLYLVEEETLEQYGGGTQVIRRELKKNIYKAGNILIADQEEKLKATDQGNIGARLEILKDIDKIQSKLIYYINEPKTRPVEKQLKKLKTPEEIYPIFMNGVINK